MSITAMKQALEALEVCEQSNYGRNWVWPDTAHPTAMSNVKEAITAIKEALAQPEQEPVAWQGCDLDGMVEAFERVIEAHFFRKNPFHNPIDADAQMALRILRGFIPYMKQYTTPPQRTWVGLTDEEVITMSRYDLEYAALIGEVERKLKEKNT